MRRRGESWCAWKNAKVSTRIVIIHNKDYTKIETPAEEQMSKY
jgi:hypothetical protein